LGNEATNNGKCSNTFCGMQQSKMGNAARNYEECSINNGNAAINHEKCSS